MSFVQSFSAVTPPPRYDDVAWTDLEIWEAETDELADAGTFTLIDTQAIPVDATPATPNTLEITTTLAEFAVGWYRFRFRDDDANSSNYTSAVLAPAGADGSAYFTVSDLRERFTDDLADYSDAEIQRAIDDAVEAYEKEAGLAFVPRTASATITELVDARTIRLPRRLVRSIVSATGATTGTIDVSEARIQRRLVTLPTAWPAGEDIDVVYEHGRDAPLSRTLRATQLLARAWLIQGPVDDRATQIASAGGGVINLATPGLLGAVFGIPEVDAALNADRDRAYVI